MLRGRTPLQFDKNDGMFDCDSVNPLSADTPDNGVWPSGATALDGWVVVLESKFATATPIVAPAEVPSTPK